MKVSILRPPGYEPGTLPLRQPAYMHPVGFEPTNLTIPGLKSGALDHSAKNAGCWSFIELQYIMRDLSKFFFE